VASANDNNNDNRNKCHNVHSAIYYKKSMRSHSDFSRASSSYSWQYKKNHKNRRSSSGKSIIAHPIQPPHVRLSSASYRNYSHYRWRRHEPSSHTNYTIAEQLVQLYQNKMFHCTKTNDLILNQNKSTATLFAPDTHDSGVAMGMASGGVAPRVFRGAKIVAFAFKKCFFKFGCKMTSKRGDEQKKIIRYFLGKLEAQNKMLGAKILNKIVDNQKRSAAIFGKVGGTENCLYPRSPENAATPLTHEKNDIL